MSQLEGNRDASRLPEITLQLRIKQETAKHFRAAQIESMLLTKIRLEHFCYASLLGRISEFLTITDKL